MPTACPISNENYISYLMALQGLAGTYDPDADSDGDGFSNRAEFLAGTNPLNAADRLVIAAAGADDSNMTGEGLFAITFVTAAGRTYSVRATADLAAMDGAGREPFRADPSAETTQTYLHASSQEAGIVTVYLVPQVATRFYQICDRVKDRDKPHTLTRPL